MRRPSIASLLVFLLVAALSPNQSLAQTEEASTYGPLPVFEFHSGFWVNLHHTLYQEAKFRNPPAPDDKDKSSSKTRPTLKTTAKSGLSASEQRAWNDALNYYSANYTDKDLLFTT
ncbi:MAG: hypothetical protein M3N22_07190, partial [Acidobacteriota bacterium]|nr:hypothetical protein [Acidobacteriota bacterium]